MAGVGLISPTTGQATRALSDVHHGYRKSRVFTLIVSLCGCTSRSQRSDPDTAHPSDDRGRDDDADRDAYHPKGIGVASIDAVRDQHHSQARRDVAQDEEDAERVMRQETDVPGVMDEPGWGADREIPIGRYAEKGAGVDEDRVHVPEDEQREIGTRGDLICPV